MCCGMGADTMNPKVSRLVPCPITEGESAYTLYTSTWDSRLAITTHRTIDTQSDLLSHAIKLRNTLSSSGIVGHYDVSRDIDITRHTFTHHNMSLLPCTLVETTISECTSTNSSNIIAGDMPFKGSLNILSIINYNRDIRLFPSIGKNDISDTIKDLYIKLLVRYVHCPIRSESGSMSGRCSGLVADVLLRHNTPRLSDSICIVCTCLIRVCNDSECDRWDVIIDGSRYRSCECAVNRAWSVRLSLSLDRSCVSMELISDRTLVLSYARGVPMRMIGNRWFSSREILCMSKIYSRIGLVGDVGIGPQYSLEGYQSSIYCLMLGCINTPMARIYPYLHFVTQCICNPFYVDSNIATRVDIDTPQTHPSNYFIGTSTGVDMWNSGVLRGIPMVSTYTCIANMPLTFEDCVMISQSYADRVTVTIFRRIPYHSSDNVYIGKCIPANIDDGIIRNCKVYDMHIVDGVTYIVTMYKRNLINGDKVTLFNSPHKGVVVILPDNEMPSDDQGVTAEMVIGSTTIIKRCTPSTMYELATIPESNTAKLAESTADPIEHRLHLNGHRVTRPDGSDVTANFGYLLVCISSEIVEKRYGVRGGVWSRGYGIGEMEYTQMIGVGLPHTLSSILHDDFITVEVCTACNRLDLCICDKPMFCRVNVRPKLLSFVRTLRSRYGIGSEFVLD